MYDCRLVASFPGVLSEVLIRFTSRTCLAAHGLVFFLHPRFRARQRDMPTLFVLYFTPSGQMIPGTVRQDASSRQASYPLNQIFLLRDQCRIAMNKAALVAESTQSHVQEIGKCFEGFCQTTRRTRRRQCFLTTRPGLNAPRRNATAQLSGFHQLNSLTTADIRAHGSLVSN